MTIESDIQRRKIRNLTKSFTDLIAILVINNVKIDKMYVNNTFWVNHELLTYNCQSVINLYSLILITRLIL